MNTKNKIGIMAITALAGLTFAATNVQNPAKASAWHSSAIPAKLRGHWYAKANPHQGVIISRHAFKFSGESTVKGVKWRYVGNNFYRLKGRYDNSSSLVHYFGPHKMSMNSFWHSYFR